MDYAILLEVTVGRILRAKHHLPDEVSHEGARIPAKPRRLDTPKDRAGSADTEAGPSAAPAPASSTGSAEAALTGAMAIEFKVTLEDRPGTLARLGGVLGDARVNIEAIQGMSRDGKSLIQFVPSEPDKAAHALDAAGIPYTRREVLIVKVLDQPGMLGDVALVMSKAGVNIDSVYVTARGHIVLGVDDLVGAIQVAGGMAVMTLE